MTHSEETNENEQYRIEMQESVISEIKVTTTPAEDAILLMEIPEDVEGLTIIEVGLGGSDFIATMIEKGAHAIGVDPIYEGSQPQIQEYLDDGLATILPQIQDEKQAKYLQVFQSTSIHFFSSLNLFPDNYHPGYFTAIPLPDSISDITVILNSFDILPKLDFISESKYDFTYMGLRELIRITKPMCEIKILPYLRNEVSQFQTIFDATLERLISEGYITVEVDTDLKIISPSELGEYNGDRLRLQVLKII